MRTTYYKKHIQDAASSSYWTKVWKAEEVAAPKRESKCYHQLPTVLDNNSQQKHVHFSYVTVREYEIRPSDTPAVSSGAGIELGWNYKVLLEATPLIDFDEARIKYRRKYYQYSSGLSALQRRIRLSEFGYSKEEIDDASKRAAILRRANEKSIRRMRLDCFAELGEDLSRNWKHLKVKMGVCHKEVKEDSADLQRGEYNKKLSTGSSNDK